MKKATKSNETVISVKIDSREAFFTRGKTTAKLLDRKKSTNKSRTISFEDPEDLAEFLKKTKLMLLAAVRKKPDSISALAKRLHRSRAAINKDIQMLESIGIVESEYVVNPGHGRCRIIKGREENPIKLIVETIL